MSNPGTVKRLSSLIAASERDLPEPVRLLAYVRQVLEERNERSAYPTLSLYCDWMLHVALDRHEAGNNILRAVNRALAETTKTISVHSEDPNAIARLVETISAAFSLQELRLELLALLASIGIVDGVDSLSAHWDQSAAAILLELAAKPIRLPNNAGSAKPNSTQRKLFDELRTLAVPPNARGTDMMITQVALHPRRESETSVVFDWHLVTKGNVTIIGALTQ